MECVRVQNHAAVQAHVSSCLLFLWYLVIALLSYLQAEQMLCVGGRMLMLSRISQDDIDKMTSEEFDEYSKHAESYEEFLNDA